MDRAADRLLVLSAIVGGSRRDSEAVTSTRSFLPSASIHSIGGDLIGRLHFPPSNPERRGREIELVRGRTTISKAKEGGKGRRMQS